MKGNSSRTVNEGSGVYSPLPNVIKGGYQVISPTAPPDPAPAGSWGTATPSSASVNPPSSSPASKRSR